MAREQTSDSQQQHAITIMLAKQTSALAQKLLPLVAHNSTGSVILPGKALELVSIMEWPLPWTLRLMLLRLLFELPVEQQLDLLMSRDSKGSACLRRWFQAASNIAEEAKREALHLALLQTFAILRHAHDSLVQPWMLSAADELAATCPLHTVRLAAMKFRRLSEMQADWRAPGEGSTTGINMLTCVTLLTTPSYQHAPCLASVVTTLTGHS